MTVREIAYKELDRRKEVEVKDLQDEVKVLLTEITRLNRGVSNLRKSLDIRSVLTIESATSQDVVL